MKARSDASSATRSFLYDGTMRRLPVIRDSARSSSTRKELLKIPQNLKKNFPPILYPNQMMKISMEEEEEEEVQPRPSLSSHRATSESTKPLEP